MASSGGGEHRPAGQRRTLWALLAGMAILSALLARGVLESPAARALEDPPILALSPSSGAPGDLITMTGSKWPTGDNIRLFASEEEAYYETGLLVAATPEGDGTINVQFQVPDLDVGQYGFYACWDCGPGSDYFDSTTFTVTEKPVLDPSLDLDPAEGSQGDEVLVSGSGWLPEDGPVAVFADGGLSVDPSFALESFEVPEGAFSGTLTVPDLMPGERTFYACQRCNDPRGPSATRTFLSLMPSPVPDPDPPRPDPTQATSGAASALTFALSPASRRPGREVTASGTGWNDDLGAVSIFVDEADSTDPALALVSEPVSNGGFTTKFAAPGIEPDTYEFFACQACGQATGLTQVAAFTVLSKPVAEQSLSLDPPSAQPGERVTVSGAGWAPRRGPVLLFSDVGESDDPSNALVTAQPLGDGTFEATLEIPDAEAADYTYYACQDCGNTAGFPLASRSFTVTSGPNTLAGLLIGLAALGLGIAGHQLWRRRTSPASGRAATRTPSPGPSLRVDPDLSFDVALSPTGRPVLPTLRLVPHGDPASDLERVEIT